MQLTFLSSSVRTAESPDSPRLQCRVSQSTDLSETRSGTGKSRIESPALVRLVALTALFSVAAVYESVHRFAVTTPEVWVHVRTGLWILQNHAVPHSGLFTQYANVPWNDSTWLFDVMLGSAYRLFGLRSIPMALMALKAALAVVIFLLARSQRAGFWSAVLLSGVAQYVIPNLQPLPYVFSILFFAVELHLLLDSRKTGEVKRLFWLPALFVLWANLHLQFVAGLLLLSVFVVSVLLEKALRNQGAVWLNERIRPLDLKQVGIVGFLSLLATFANPYTVHLLPSAFRILYSPVGFEHFTELSSMSFRRPQEFMLMLLVMMAFLALGRLRSVAPFEILTLVAAMLVAFRIERDGWLVVLPAIGIISGALHLAGAESPSTQRKSPMRERAVVAVLTLAITAIAAASIPGSSVLMTQIGSSFPVKACDYIKTNRLAPPLFNAYSWGSFLTWYLPQYPVVVDSRIELYGNDIVSLYFDVVSGKELLESDPMVAHAGTLLLERESAMAKALTNLPGLRAQYRLVYSDDIASVFVPQTTVPLANP